MAINPLALFGLFVASLTGPHATVGDPDNATQILQSVLKNQRKVDYLHIETRRSSEGAATWKVKVQTSVEKGITVTILEPGFREGVVTVDDTKNTKTFLPDSKVVIVQPSPYQLQPSFDFRWKLIGQNYLVKSGKANTIAGQRVRELVVQPVREDIPVRRMFVDSRHLVVLRYTVDGEEGKTITVFDTKYVEFGPGPATENFGLPKAAGSVPEIPYPGPRKLLNPADSRAEAGFSARMPEKLPFGFRVSGAYLFRAGGRPYVQVKITDGMVTLTVFQWRNSRWSGPEDAKHRQEDAYNVTYGIAISSGDWMPTGVLEEIVDAFVSAAQ